MARRKTEEEIQREQELAEWKKEYERLRRPGNVVSLPDQFDLVRRLGGHIVSQSPGEPQVNHTQSPDSAANAATFEKALIATGVGSRTFAEEIKEEIWKALQEAVYQKILNLTVGPNNPHGPCQPEVTIDPVNQTVDREMGGRGE